jgi:hypothetical protein
MSPSTEAIFLGTLARKFNVRFSLTPSDVSVASRQVTVGFDLYLVGTHVNPKPASAGTCKQCQQVLIALIELADCAVPIRPTKGPSRPENNFGKLTRFSAALGCAGEVSLAVRLFRWRAFEQATDGWPMDFLMKTTKFLLDHGCRQVIEDRIEEEKLARGGSHACEVEAGSLFRNLVA